VGVVDICNEHVAMGVPMRETGEVATHHFLCIEDLEALLASELLVSSCHPSLMLL
jgi:hypothetical protein